MKYITLPIKNIFTLIRKNTIITMLLIISQIISVIVVMLAYGIIMNSGIESKEVNKFKRSLSAYTRDNYMEFKNVKDTFEKIFEEYGDRIESICVGGYDEEHDTEIWSHFAYKNGNIIQDEEWIKTTMALQTNCKGRMFSEEEFYNGKKVIIINAGWEDIESCMIAGEEYEVVGQFFEGGYMGSKVIEIPYLSIGENMKISNMSIYLKTLPTITEYNYFATTMFDLFGYEECNIELPEKFANDTKNMYKTYAIIAVIMLGMSVINISIVYGYILKVRKKNNAVMSLCGGKKREIILINLIEIVIICMVSYIVAATIFIHITIPSLKDIFIYFKGIYKDYVYIDMFAMYLVTVIIAGLYNTIKVLRKSTVQILR